MTGWEWVGFAGTLASISIRAAAGVRKWSCQAERQQTVFTGVTHHESSVRESLLCWTDLPVTGFYTYPEHTPTTAVSA